MAPLSQWNPQTKDRRTPTMPRSHRLDVANGVRDVIEDDDGADAVLWDEQAIGSHCLSW